MEHAARSIIDKALEVVWSYLGDPTKWPTWAEDLAEVRADPESKLGRRFSIGV